MKKEGVQETIGHINAVDGIRGVAVLMVVFFHYFVLRTSILDDIFVNFVKDNSWLSFMINHGYLGVDIFFILTGFLLISPWLSYKYKKKKKPEIKKYFYRRFFRIAPAYYLHLFILFLLFIPILQGKAIIFSKYGVENILHHLFFTHYLTPISSGSFGVNGALWTLSLEAQFYFILPIIGYFLIRKFWTTLSVLIFSSIFWRYISYTKETIISDFYMEIGSKWSLPLETIQNFIGTQLFGYLGHFSLGILLSYLFIKKVRISQNIALIIAIISIILLYFILNSSLDLHLYSITIPFCLLGILYYFVSFPKSIFTKIISNKFLSYIGVISYSMYLYHFPLLIILNKIPSNFSSKFIPIVLYLISLLIISHISYKYIEKPFINKKK